MWPAPIRTDLLKGTRGDLQSPKVSLSEEDEKAFKQEQEALLQEIQALTRQLREASERIQHQINSDMERLDTIEESVDRNLHSTRAENTRLRQHASKGWSQTKWSFLMLFAVTILFVVTYLFMKIVPKPPTIVYVTQP
jgi:hypothetical protein